MNKPLSGWQLLGIAVFFYIVFFITKLVVVATIADIVFVISIVVGIRNHSKSLKGSDEDRT
jgi:hypothetical protein